MRAGLRPRYRAILICLLLVYWAVSLNHLTIVPPVFEDEPWQASTGWKLATSGTFGSDLFAGFYNMERRYYGYMPLHPMVLAGVFKIAGIGLFQDRFEPVALGLLTLALTFCLARRLFKDHRVGLLAILFLITVRTAAVTPFLISGIVFLDIARISRYDMLVPVLGLTALHAYMSARASRQPSPRLFLLAGMLAGLAGLAHLYGLFWLIILVVLAIWDGWQPTFAKSTEVPLKWSSAVGYMLLGVIITWLPYFVYVLTDLPDWRGQTHGYGERFELLSPRWYLENILNERWRYRAELGSFGPTILVRTGIWSALVAVPLSGIALVWRGIWKRDGTARVIAVPLVVLPLLFAVLIHHKFVNYLVAMVPIATMAAAWGSITFWDWLLGRRDRLRWVRWAAVALLVAVVVEGATRIAVLNSAATTTTPYHVYMNKVRGYVPPGARVLGLQTYWLGWEEYDYRSFAVPIFWTYPWYEPRPQAFDEGLERIAPDYVLLDEKMRLYFADNARDGGNHAALFGQWLQRHDGQLVGRVEDATYGRMDIYSVRR
ncbi:MAG: glycosyltransferase family 39 protein [Anaerolineae bacterium]|nr:glycosyltransferase family 39 protein [Anaerolineae bacterium]